VEYGLFLLDANNLGAQQKFRPASGFQNKITRLQGGRWVVTSGKHFQWWNIRKDGFT